jgi:hypothetical protein
MRLRQQCPLRSLLLPYGRYCAACRAGTATSESNLATYDVALSDIASIISHRKATLRRNSALPRRVPCQPASKLGCTVFNRQWARDRNCRDTASSAVRRG